MVGKDQQYLVLITFYLRNGREVTRISRGGEGTRTLCPLGELGGGQPFAAGLVD